MHRVPKQFSRRKVIKSLGAGAAVLAAPRLFATAKAAGRTIKIGMVTPETGPIAAFAEANPFVLAGVRKALEGGIVVAGERHAVEILDRDSQSTANRASEVASQLINNDQVDLMVASSTGDTTNPVSDQCEL
ncbi:MAG: ABC transporter substrate-binding protein, partial [Stellaceae bacterium]